MCSWANWPSVSAISESVARVVVSVAADDLTAVTGLAADLGVPLTRLGEVTGDALEVTGLFAVPVSELRATSDATLPALFA